MGVGVGKIHVNTGKTMDCSIRRSDEYARYFDKGITTDARKGKICFFRTGSAQAQR